MVHDPTPTKKVQLSTHTSSCAPRTCTCQGLLRLTCQRAQLSAALSCHLHMALVGLHLVSSVVDSHASLHPPREFWTQKGWDNRIRHVDPPKSNLLQKLEAHATSQSPRSGSRRRSSSSSVSAAAAAPALRCCCCSLLRPPSARAPAEDRRGRGLKKPGREFWTRKGWHNRIRHVDPPIPNLFQY